MRSGKIATVKLVAVLVVVLLFGAGAGIFAGKRVLKTPGGGSSSTAQAADPKGGSGGKGKTAGKADAPEAQILDLGQFIVNVESTTSLHYVKCDIALEVTGLDAKPKHGEGEAADPLTPMQEARAKDAVVRVFGATPFAQLQSTAGRDKLRKSLASALTDALGGPQVGQVLFTSFVMQ